MSLLTLTDNELELIAGRARRRISNDFDPEWSEIVLRLVETIYDIRQRAQTAELFTHMVRQPAGSAGPK